MEETNPVVLLTADVWHIVENSRQSPTAVCGQPIRERRAHARLKQVGVANVCQKCVRVWQNQLGEDAPV